MTRPSSGGSDSGRVKSARVGVKRGLGEALCEVADQGLQGAPAFVYCVDYAARLEQDVQRRGEDAVATAQVGPGAAGVFHAGSEQGAGFCYAPRFAFCPGVQARPPVRRQIDTGQSACRRTRITSSTCF